MRTRLIDQLKADEGFVPHAYKDHLGYWTIGYGRLIDKERGGGVSEAEAEFLLHNDVGRFESQLRSQLPWFGRLDPVRQDTLIAMAFQLGVGGLMGFPRMLDALRDERWAEAETHALDSLWAKQTPKRARRMARQLALGEWQ